MSRITGDEVRELALLARLRLSEQEVAAMTDNLGAILEYVDALRALDTAAIEPMTHAVPFDCPTRDDDGEAVAAARRGAGERPAPRRQLLPGSTNRPRVRRPTPEVAVVSAPLDARGATAVAIADGVRAGKWLARDVAEQYLDRIARLDGALGCLPAGRRRRAPARRADAVDAARKAGRDPGALAGVPLGVKDIFCHARGRDHLRVEDPARVRPALRVDGDGAARGGGRGHRWAS